MARHGRTGGRASLLASLFEDQVAVKVAHLTTVDLSLRYLLLAQLDASVARGDEVLGI